MLKKELNFARFWTNVLLPLPPDYNTYASTGNVESKLISEGGLTEPQID